MLGRTDSPSETLAMSPRPSSGLSGSFRVVSSPCELSIKLLRFFKDGFLDFDLGFGESAGGFDTLTVLTLPVRERGRSPPLHEPLRFLSSGLFRSFQCSDPAYLSQMQSCLVLC